MKSKYTKKFKPDIIIIKAKDFITRADLDSFVNCEYNHSIDDNKANVVIEGTVKELKNLQLDELTTVCGIKTRTT